MVPCGVQSYTHPISYNLVMMVLELLYKVIKSEIVGALLGHLRIQQ
jgi:hypothetical protein